MNGSLSCVTNQKTLVASYLTLLQPCVEALRSARSLPLDLDPALPQVRTPFKAETMSDLILVNAALPLQ